MHPGGYRTSVAITSAKWPRSAASLQRCVVGESNDFSNTLCVQLSQIRGKTRSDFKAEMTKPYVCARAPLRFTWAEGMGTHWSVRVTTHRDTDGILHLTRIDKQEWRG